MILLHSLSGLIELMIGSKNEGGRKQIRHRCLFELGRSLCCDSYMSKDLLNQIYGVQASSTQQTRGLGRIQCDDVIVLLHVSEVKKSYVRFDLNLNFSILPSPANAHLSYDDCFNSHEDAAVYLCNQI